MIATADGKAFFMFDKKDFFLVYGKDDRFGDESMIKTWSLNYKVDRADIGQDPDVGIAVIYLTEEEAEKLKATNFDWFNL